MSRTPRPSDVHGRPAPAVRPPPPTQPAPRGGRGRLPLFVGASAVVLLGAGLLLSGGAGNDTANPRVDVVVEDDAVAALGLFAAEAAAYDDLVARNEVLAPPGPGDAAIRAQAAAGRVARSLQTARQLAPGDPRIRAYWNDPAHDAHVRLLEQLAGHARELALLAATHDSVYGGAGAIPLPEAQSQLTSLFTTGGAPAPLASWAQALLAEIDGEASAPAAQNGRTASVAWWQAQLPALAPPRTDVLQGYVAALPDATLRGLRGHPVAGPALARLGR